MTDQAFSTGEVQRDRLYHRDMAGHCLYCAQDCKRRQEQ